MGVGRRFRTILTKVNLKYVSATNANFELAILDESDLSFSHFQSASFLNTSLKKVILKETNLTSANLTDAILSESIIENVNLTDAILKNAIFKLSGNESIIINKSYSYAKDQVLVLKGKDLEGYLINQGARIIGINYGKDLDNTSESNFL